MVRSDRQGNPRNQKSSRRELTGSRGFSTIRPKIQPHRFLILFSVGSCASRFRVPEDSENPTLNLGRLALMRFKFRAEELFEAAITVRPLQPFGDREGVLLVGPSSCAWKCLAPERRVDLRHNRAIGRHAPTVQ